MQEAIKEAEDKILPNNYYNILKNEIIQLQPKVIVPFGDLTLMRLTGEKSVNKFRGSVLPLIGDIQDKCEYPIRVIPTFPLNQMMFDFKCRFYCSIDLKKALSNVYNISPIQDDLTIWICKSAEEAKNYLKRIQEAEFITMDIETVGGLPVCIGLSHNGREGVCFPIANDRTIDLPNRALTLKYLTSFLNSNFPKVNQNIKYDQTILERFIPPINNIVFDTQIAAGLIYSELPKNLGFLTSI